MKGPYRKCSKTSYLTSHGPSLSNKKCHPHTSSKTCGPNIPSAGVTPGCTQPLVMKCIQHNEAPTSFTTVPWHHHTYHPADFSAITEAAAIASPYSITWLREGNKYTTKVQKYSHQQLRSFCDMTSNTYFPKHRVWQLLINTWGWS